MPVKMSVGNNFFSVGFSGFTVWLPSSSSVEGGG